MIVSISIVIENNRGMRMSQPQGVKVDRLEAIRSHLYVNGFSAIQDLADAIGASLATGPSIVLPLPPSFRPPSGLCSTCSSSSPFARLTFFAGTASDQCRRDREQGVVQPGDGAFVLRSCQDPSGTPDTSLGVRCLPGS